MTKLVITPLYYVGSDLVDELTLKETNKIILVVTDDLSPIYPLEERMHWFNTSVHLRPEVEVVADSTIYHDDTEEFKEEINKVIKRYTDAEEGIEVVAFLTKDAHKNLKGQKWKTRRFKSPRVIKADELYGVFSARHGKEFARITRGKLRELPLNEHHYVYLTFEDNGVRWMSLMNVYDGATTTQTQIHASTNLWPSVAELNRALTWFAIMDANLLVTGAPINLGWVGIESAKGTYWAVPVQKPEWFSTAHPSVPITATIDLLFVPAASLKSNDPISLWCVTALEAELEGNDDPEQA